MNNLNLEDLKQLLLIGRQAAQYAWDHYDELSARKPVYTLYGPYAYGTGAAIPGKFIKKSARLLKEKTRREKYIIYELDSEYKLIRTKQVYKNVHEQTYHCFEMDGIQYAYPFAYDRKEVRRDEVLALEWRDGKPYYFAFLRSHSVLAQYFEHISEEKMNVTLYAYNNISEYSLCGYPTDFNAPLGELNSPASRGDWVEDAAYTDFSLWFKKVDENSELQNNVSP